jgi:hypothetical protein
MSCEHCEQIRDEQRRFIARHGHTGFGPWTYHDVLVPVFDDAGLFPLLNEHGGQVHRKRRIDWPKWTTFPLSELVDCRCDCHAVARIGGLLPRLER